MQLQLRKSDAMSLQLLFIKYNWSDTKKKYGQDKQVVVLDDYK